MHQLANRKNQPTTDLLDDSLSKLLMKDMEHPFNNPKSNKSINPPPKAPTPSKVARKAPQSKDDKDLLGSMANRLQKLEKTCQSQRQQIKVC